MIGVTSFGKISITMGAKVALDSYSRLEQVVFSPPKNFSPGDACKDIPLALHL